MSATDSTHASSQFLSPEQFSEAVGCGIATVRRLIDAGKIQVYQPGGKGTRVAIPRTELESLKRRGDGEQRREALPPTSPSTKRRSGPAPRWMQDDE
jgi:excisionase family DNA binding protein